MTKLLKKYIHHLHLLNHTCCKNRNVIIRNSSPELIRCICEVCYNLLRGNIPLTKTKKQKLKQYRNIIRYLGSKQEKNLALKKQKLVQRGGFLPIVLPTILTVAAEI